MSLGETIKTLRRKRGLHQWQLAEKLSVPQSCVSDWERDAYKPRRDRIDDVAAALGVKSSILRKLMP